MKEKPFDGWAMEGLDAERRTPLHWVMSASSCVPIIPPDPSFPGWKAGDDRASQTGLIIRAI